MPALLSAGKRLLTVVVHVWIARKSTMLISGISWITRCVSLGAIAIIVVGTVAVPRVGVAVSIWIVIAWRLRRGDPLIRISAQGGGPFDGICSRKRSDHDQHADHHSREKCTLPSHGEPPYCILCPTRPPGRGESSEIPYLAGGPVATANDSVPGVRKESRQADKAIARS